MIMLILVLGVIVCSIIYYMKDHLLILFIIILILAWLVNFLYQLDTII